MSVAIKIENLSKQYRLGLVGTKTLVDDANRWWARIKGKGDPTLKLGEENTRDTKGESDYVWALKDINLTVNEGEVLGIIGKNGAGKSTLLKILSKVTGPTTGSVKAMGRIASLLEVGTGFHPELTGKENIFLNGAILGMTKAEIKRKLDEIITFSGVAKYINTPVKRYSSGMKVRLGFAVAAHLEPEILVVDEVLAVGDVEFQRKCVEKMQNVASTGRTVLFVSHNMSSIRNLCNKVMVLQDGKTVFNGSVDQGIEHYLSMNESELSTNKFIYKGESNKALVLKAESNFLQKIEFNTEIISFNFQISLEETIIGLFMGLILEDSKGNMLMVSSTDEVDDDVFRKIKKTGVYNLEAFFPGKILKPGKYYLTFSLRNAENIYHKEERAVSFEVIDTQTYRGIKDRYRAPALIAPECHFKLTQH